MNNQQLLEIASRLGYSMQKCGAEIYRIEDSLTRVLTALGATDVNVFVINSAVMLSIKTGEETVLSEIRRSPARGTDLYKLNRLNSLCRRICSVQLEYQNIIDELESIESKKAFSFPIKLLGFIMVSVGFCLIFGGEALEALAALAISLVVFPLVYVMERLKTGIFFKNIIASAAIALLAILFSAFVLSVNIDKVIIGTFMNLVPGVALVTSMRDIIAGDLIAGKNTLTEAIIIAIGMALGAGIVLALLQFMI